MPKNICLGFFDCSLDFAELPWVETKALSTWKGHSLGSGSLQHSAHVGNSVVEELSGNTCNDNKEV